MPLGKLCRELADNPASQPPGTPCGMLVSGSGCRETKVQAMPAAFDAAGRDARRSEESLGCFEGFLSLDRRVVNIVLFLCGLGVLVDVFAEIDVGTGSCGGDGSELQLGPSGAGVEGSLFDLFAADSELNLEKKDGRGGKAGARREISG
jgi:hypothetical protein